jgi:hypothetical protein
MNPVRSGIIMRKGENYMSNKNLYSQQGEFQPASNGMKKILQFIIIALLFLTLGFLFGLSYQPQTALAPVSPTVNVPAKIKAATVLIKFSDNEVREIQNVSITKDETVLDLTDKVAKENNLIFKTKDYGSLGVLITQIGEKINGQDNMYWQFLVDDKYSEIGASLYKLQGGEKIEWRFAKDNYKK